MSRGSSIWLRVPGQVLRCAPAGVFGHASDPGRRGAARRLLLRATFGGGTSTRTSDNTHASAWSVLRGPVGVPEIWPACTQQWEHREHGGRIGRRTSNGAGLRQIGQVGTGPGTDREQREQHRDEREETPSHQLLLFGLRHHGFGWASRSAKIAFDYDWYQGRVESLCPHTRKPTG